MSWRLLNWEEAEDKEKLLMARIKQLDERNIAETLAALELERHRRGNKLYFDKVKRVHPEHQQLHLGDLVPVVCHAMKERRTGSKYKLDDDRSELYRFAKYLILGFAIWRRWMERI